MMMVITTIHDNNDDDDDCDDAAVTADDDQPCSEISSNSFMYGVVGYYCNKVELILKAKHFDMFLFVL